MAEPFLVQGDHGISVKFLQLQLTRHGFKLAVDGVFGPSTLAAVKSFQTHSHIGVDGRVGPLTWAKLLVGNPTPVPQPTPPQPVQRSPQERLISIERHEIGVKEDPPNTNRGPRVDQYEKSCGIHGEPWCGCFQRWSLDQLGYKGPLPPNPAYVPSWVAWAKHEGLTVSHPEPGDLVCFDWNHDGIGDHIGLVEAWPYTIEGNTSESSQSNGGEVMERVRSIGDVEVFIRLPLK